MARTGSHKSPARARYEEKTRVLSARVPLETREKLYGILTARGLTFAGWLKETLEGGQPPAEGMQETFLRGFGEGVRHGTGYALELFNPTGAGQSMAEQILDDFQEFILPCLDGGQDGGEALRYFAADWLDSEEAKRHRQAWVAQQVVEKRKALTP